MIYRATINDIKDVAVEASFLWPNYSIEYFMREYQDILASNKSLVLLAKEDERIIGFCQMQLRFEYVEKTTTSPVAYLEGIYVNEGYRRKGIASSLITQAERWAKDNQVCEMGSDCEFDNISSYQLHLKLGFKEVNIIRCFTKKVK